MSLKLVFDALEDIKNHPGKKDKRRLIKEHLEKIGEDFYYTALYAYDPFMRFKTTKVNYVPENRGSVRLAFEYLDRLAGQRGCKKAEVAELSALASVDRETVSVILRIVKKDLRCGCSAKSFREAGIDIPQHDVMLARKDFTKFYKRAGSNDNVIAGMKMNGVRTWAVVEKPNAPIRYISRKGLDYPNFKVFDETIHRWLKYGAAFRHDIEYPITLDGEVIPVDGRFNSIMSNLRAMSKLDPEIFRFFIFDVVWLDKTQDERLKFVGDQFPTHDGNLANITATDPEKVYALEHDYWHGCTSLEDYHTYTKKVIAEGNEGVVLKTRDGMYEYKRSNNWCKVKAMYIKGEGIEVDLPVLRWVYGTGRNSKRMGKLICDYNGVEVGVGTGYTDAEREDFMENTPVMIEVWGDAETEDGSILFPSYQRVRDDK